MLKKLHFISLLWLFTLPLCSYIDPSTGSIIIQIIIAGVLAGTFFFRTQWLKVSGLFKKIFGKKNINK